MVSQWRSSVNLHNWNTLEDHWKATGTHWKHTGYQQLFLQWHSSVHWCLSSRHTRPLAQGKGYDHNKQFYADKAVRGLGIPYSANRRPRLPWHHWKALHCRSTSHGKVCQLDCIAIARGLPDLIVIVSLYRLKMHTSSTHAKKNFQVNTAWMKLYSHCVCPGSYLTWWCLHSSTIMTSSRVHSDVLSKESGVDLRPVIPI